MRAMVMEKVGQPLAAQEFPLPSPGPGQVLVRVETCAVCRTDLHVLDGELDQPKLPLIPGHEIVGTIVQTGPGARAWQHGDRVGIPWLGWTCGQCKFCRSARENLCPQARFTGYTLDGGYAEFTLADERYCFRLPERYSSLEAAPLLCGGLIGYRSFRQTGEARSIGIYGFGAAAHLITQVAVRQGRQIYAFTRPGDLSAQQFALEMGAAWAGNAEQHPPEPMEAAIIFAPIGALVVQALRALERGGIVICGGIHMSDIPSFPYELLWNERRIVSIANLTRQDAEEFMALAQTFPLQTRAIPYPLEHANEALTALREGRLNGAAVLIPGPPPA